MAWLEDAECKRLRKIEEIRQREEREQAQIAETQRKEREAHDLVWNSQRMQLLELLNDFCKALNSSGLRARGPYIDDKFNRGDVQLGYRTLRVAMVASNPMRFEISFTDKSGEERYDTGIGSLLIGKTTVPDLEKVKNR